MKSPMTRSRAGSSVDGVPGSVAAKHDEVLVGREDASGCPLRRVLEGLGAVALGPRQVADHLGQALVLVHVGGVGGLERAQHEPLGAQRGGGERRRVEGEPQRGRSVGGCRGGAIGLVGAVGHDASAWAARGAGSAASVA